MKNGNWFWALATVGAALWGLVGCDATPAASQLDGSWACYGTNTPALVAPSGIVDETDDSVTFAAPVTLCDLPSAQTLHYLLNCQLPSCPDGPNQLFLSIPGSSVEEPTAALNRL